MSVTHVPGLFCHLCARSVPPTEHLPTVAPKSIIITSLNISIILGEERWADGHTQGHRLIDKVAHFRAKSDFRWSLLHDYGLVEQSREVCRSYVTRRTKISPAEADRRLRPPALLEQHWMNRAPWSRDPLPPRGEDSGGTVRISTICVNTGVLLALADLLDAKEPIEVRCGFLTALEYWSVGSFETDVDIFISEIASPIISASKASDSFALAYPIHKTVEGVITSNPLLDLNNIERRSSVPIVTSATSSVTHGRLRFGKMPALELSDTNKWRGVLSALKHGEVFFAWEPWLFAIDSTRHDLHVIRDGQFILGMYVNRLALDDPLRRRDVLRFLDAFVHQWRARQSRWPSLRQKEIRRLTVFPEWRETFGRGMLIAVSSVESEHPVTAANRDEIETIIEMIAKQVAADPKLITSVTRQAATVIADLGALSEEDMFKVRELVTSLLRSRKKPWEKLSEIHAFIQTMAIGAQPPKAGS